VTTYRNILVIVDGGRAGEAAFESALAEVAASSGRLSIIATIDRWSIWAASVAGSGAACVPTEDLEQIATRTLGHALARVPADVPVVGMVIASPLRGADVAERAGRVGSDLVVAPAGGVYGRLWRFAFRRASGRAHLRQVTVH
jgi:hypothetical protein